VRQPDFSEADRRYAELKRRHELGDLSAEEFDEQLRELMVQDEEGRWWVKSRRTGEWHYNDGTDWRRGTPPGYRSSTTAGAAAHQGGSRRDMMERETGSRRSGDGAFTAAVFIKWAAIVIVVLVIAYVVLKIVVAIQSSLPI